MPLIMLHNRPTYYATGLYDTGLYRQAFSVYCVMQYLDCNSANNKTHIQSK